MDGLILLNSGMVTIKAYRMMALSFPEVVELPHFDRSSFRVRNRIFTTILEKDHLVMVKLSPLEQSVFCSFNKDIIYPVPGGWGRGGATYIRLKKVPPGLLKDALTTAYCLVAPKKLVEQLNS